MNPLERIGSNGAEVRADGTDDLSFLIPLPLSRPGRASALSEAGRQHVDQVIVRRIGKLPLSQSEPTEPKIEPML